MKFALALLFGALISIASAQKNGRWRFRITVTSCRDELPSLSGGLDYDMWGIGGFGRGGNSSGFVSVRCP